MTTCDHVVGSHGSRLIRGSEWMESLGAFAAGVHFFNWTTAAVPHHGHMRPHAHCLDCGARLNLAALRSSLSEAVTVAIDAVLGTTEHLPMRPAISLADYMNWLAGITSTPATPKPLRIADFRSEGEHP